MLNFSFRHMDTSDPLVMYTTDKLNPQLESLATRGLNVHTTFLVDNRTHIVKTHISGTEGLDLEVTGESHDMYKAVDLLARRLRTRLKKYKDKRTLVRSNWAT